MAAALPASHQRRLREIWRSAGWPCQDLIEVELLAAGLLERQPQPDGRETLRVTDSGIAAMAGYLQRNRAARDAHEALVARVAREMQRAGRIVWRGLALRAKVAVEDAERWVTALPDVFSIRHTTVEDYVEPIVHEVKVRRADLLADLKRPAKGAAYRFMASQCWYVLAPGIGSERDVPEDYGVMVASPLTLEVLRPAPARAMRLPFSTWITLARAVPEPPMDDEAQALLGEAGEPGAGDPGGAAAGSGA